MAEEREKEEKKMVCCHYDSFGYELMNINGTYVTTLQRNHEW